MNIKDAIRKADNAYITYQQACDTLASEAQEYIDWDDNVGCQHFPADGLCIMATLPDNCGVFGMPECVCPIKSFFEFVEAGNAISPREFKSMSI